LTAELLVITPEAELEMAYLTDFQRRKLVRQNLFYTQEGARAFYTYRNQDFTEIRWQDEVAFFQRQPFWSAEDATAFVSLGCGNTAAELPLLRHLHARAPWAYFGVDSSRAMLALAQETLRDAPFPATLLLADFTHSDFYAARDWLLAPYATRVYANIGGTFGNFDQAQIAAALRDLIPAGDYLYLDVVPKPEDAEEVAALTQRFTQLAANYRRFFASVLERLCIPQEYGAVISETGTDPDLDTVRCTFRFQAREELRFPCFDEMIPLYPGETLELLTIRAYDGGRLCDFMAGYGFARVDQFLPDTGSLSHRWLRLLFQRV